MRKLVNQKQMKAIDAYSIEQIGIPAMVLMENAALQSVEIMEATISKEDIILIVSGSGNNGGDGFAVARTLLNRGYQVDVFFAGKTEQLTEEAKQQLDIVEKMDLVIWTDLDEIQFANYTVIVDALLGIGLDREIKGDFVKIIEQINKQESFVYAIDIPSGVSADNGQIMGIAVKADKTITFGLKKVGQLLHPGAEYCGQINVVDSGFPQMAIDAVPSHFHTYGYEDLIRLPARKNYTNKGSFGRVLIVAGSENMSGAAFLSAKAALRMGVGLVEVLTPEANRTIIQAQLPEAILTTFDPENLDDRDEKEKIKQTVERANNVVVGPGIGTSDKSHQLLDLVTLYIETPVVFDADAINLAAEYYNTFPLMREKSCVRINELSSSLPAGSIVTPHLKELARLLDWETSHIQDNLLQAANTCAHDSDLVFVIKDARTIITHGEQRYVNTSGNNGMATGGTGDVLTGIIVGLLAQGVEPFEAAKLGVYIHGLAGDYVAKQKSKYSLIATDLIEALGEILR